MVPRPTSAVLVAVVLSASASAAQPYANCQEVCAAARQKIHENDSRGLAACLTPDSLEALTWMAAYGAVGARQQFTKGEPGPNYNSQYNSQALDEACRRHGLSEEKFKRAALLGMLDKENCLQHYKRAVADIHHKPQFIADIHHELRQAFTKDPQTLDLVHLLDWLPKEPGDVQISGDTATTTLTITKEGKTIERKLEFKRVAESWLIHIRMDL